MNIKFIEFKKVFGEKHFGIASVILDDKIMLRYRIVPGKDGKGFYCKPASHKIGENYVDSFEIDSNFLKNAIDSTIRDHVHKELDDGMPF